jgi:hypothetical protein
VALRVAAEVFQTELRQFIDVDSGSDFVVKERYFVVIEIQPPVEAAEVVNGVEALLLDAGFKQLPGVSELGQIISGVAYE